MNYFDGLRIAAGSLRPPKLNAVRRAFADAMPWLRRGAVVEVCGFEVESGVAATPLSRSESMKGARQRVQALRRLHDVNRENWDYYIGLEGGLELIEIDHSRQAFLESWVYVENASGRGNYGQAGAITLPPELAFRVIGQRVDLSGAIDEYAGAIGVRNTQGAWGVLTRGLITREEAFRIAVINAIAPFFEQ